MTKNYPNDLQWEAPTGIVMINPRLSFLFNNLPNFWVCLVFPPKSGKYRNFD